MQYGLYRSETKPSVGNGLSTASTPRTADRSGSRPVWAAVPGGRWGTAGSTGGSAGLGNGWSRCTRTPPTSATRTGTPRTSPVAAGPTPRCSLLHPR